MVESALGTLTIGVEGEAKFVGSFAGSEYLQEDNEEGDGDELRPGMKVEMGSSSGRGHQGNLDTPPTSAGVGWTRNSNRQREHGKAPYSDGAIALLDSLSPGSKGKYDIEELRTRLPDWEEEGRALVDSYWENVNWMCVPSS